METTQTLVLLKVLVMIVFFGIVMFFGTLPLRSKKYQSRPLLRAIGSTFAGCLFLNVSILHILPEASDTLQELLKGDDPQKQVFPLANLLMIIGFIITILFTRVLTFHTHEEDHQIMEDKGQTNSSPNHRHHDHRNNEQSNHELKSNLVEKSQEQQLSPTQNKSILNQAYILTLAMYFHTIFQGIAIGVQESVPGFLSIAVAIGLHKWADALSMGCHYRNKRIDKKIAYILIIGQAILNILAIGIGWIISQAGDVAQAIFLSISAGTFLAISTIEILGEQLHHKEYMKVKFGLLLAATAFISSIWFFENSIFDQ